MTRAELDRRKFLQMAAAAGAVTVFPDVEFGHAATAQEAATVFTRPVNMRVNGTGRQLEVDTRATLLDTLRERSSSPAPRRAAITASAAPAPSTSTAAA